MARSSAPLSPLRWNLFILQNHVSKSQKTSACLEGPQGGQHRQSASETILAFLLGRGAQVVRGETMKTAPAEKIQFPEPCTPVGKIFPVTHVLDRIQKTPASARLNSGDVAVAVVIASAMGPEDGRLVCFLDQRTIGRLAKLSRPRVSEHIKKITAGPWPLFIREQDRKQKLTTRGRSHRCSRYVLVHDPATLIRANEDKG